MNVYSLLYIDPPWLYRDKAKAGNRGAEFQYPCMSLDELKNMKSYIDDISNDDSVMYMWVTGPMMNVGINLMEHWGFKFKVVSFTWIKKTVNNKLFWGMGAVSTRSNPEFVILGIKGKGLKRVSASVHSVVESQIREHSRKPDEVRDRLVQLYGDVPRVELFARQHIDGWDAVGDAVGSHIEVDLHNDKV